MRSCWTELKEAISRSRHSDLLVPDHSGDLLLGLRSVLLRDLSNNGDVILEISYVFSQLHFSHVGLDGHLHPFGAGRLLRSKLGNISQLNNSVANKTTDSHRGSPLLTKDRPLLFEDGGFQGQE